MSVVDLPKKPNKLAGLMEQMKRDLESLAEYERNRARLDRVYYNELQEQGFTQVEALELVKLRSR